MSTHRLDFAKKTWFSPDSRIFLGEGLFETIRVHQKRPCYPLLHWQRMHQGALLLGIPFDLSCDMWCEQLAQCIYDAQLCDGGIKVILSGGQAPRGLDSHGETSSLLVEPFTYSHHQQALSLVSAPWQRDANNPIYQIKSVNYLESILARRQALARGADDALFFNLQHHATETTVANLFIIKHNQLYTPKLEHGVLAGITRGRILNLCKTAGIHCEEASLDSSTIAEADAIFVTNALQGTRFVKSFDGRFVPIKHPLVSQLRRLLSTDGVCWG